MSGVEDMIHAVELDLGLGEPNKIQDWYRNRHPGIHELAGNFAWCDAAVTYWAWHSGNQGAVTFGHDYCNTRTHAAAFNVRDRWHRDIAGIKRGDIVFFDWAGSDTKSAIDHVGVVTSFNSDTGRVYTIEGNYDDKVARHARTARWIAGYGRPNYAGDGGGPGIVTFPGKSFFVMGRRSPIIAAMHNRLVAEDCNKYETQTNKDVWGTGDLRSYSQWQRKLGFHGSVEQPGSDADGIPGRDSWDRLKVPRT
jgi:CHAP domain